MKDLITIHIRKGEWEVYESITIPQYLLFESRGVVLEEMVTSLLKRINAEEILFNKTKAPLP